MTGQELLIFLVIIILVGLIAYYNCGCSKEGWMWKDDGRGRMTKKLIQK